MLLYSARDARELKLRKHTHTQTYSKFAFFHAPSILVYATCTPCNMLHKPLHSSQLNSLLCVQWQVQTVDLLAAVFSSLRATILAFFVDFSSFSNMFCCYIALLLLLFLKISGSQVCFRAAVSNSRCFHLLLELDLALQRPSLQTIC